MKIKQFFLKLISAILNFKYPIILIIFWIFISINNYSPNTYLTGWDNLHPEFDYSMNLKRLLTSSWAEYQGLGAPGAHSHASELPRMIIIGLLDLIFPTNQVRYVFIFLTLIIGSLGVYYLIKNIILRRQVKGLKEFAAFCAALFYMLNVGTVQHFIVPFEMFNVQYALLPWLIYFAIKFLDLKKYKYLLSFGMLTFFAAPMAYAVMLWIAYLGGFTIFLFLNLIIQKDRKYIKPSALLFALTILINLFWLIPNLYFVFNHSNYVPTAKTNLIFSEEAFLTNQKYGNAVDIFLNKGFLFDWQIRNPNYTFEPVLGGWENHMNNEIVLAIALLCFVLIVIGILYSINKKNKLLTAFLGVFIFAFIILVGTNPPFGNIWDILISRISVLQEAIRFPFTKFSILFIFTQSLFLSAGVYAITRLITKKLRFTGGNFVAILVVILISIVYALPSFQGNFINKSLRIDIPKDYFELFDFFKEQDKTERIANFPVNSLFGWFYTNWGYQGSGFLWYGIEQPILDRDFDRWYTTLENYYDEISKAVYTNNEVALKEVLAKYAVDWIIIDEHVSSPNEESNFTLNPNFASSEMAYKETKDLLEKIPEIEKIVNFGKISVYQVKDLNKDKSYIEVLTTDSKGDPLEEKSLFLVDNFGRKTKESNFKKLNNEYVEFNNYIYTLDSKPLNLLIPQIFEEETSIPVSISARLIDTTLNVKLNYQVPSIEINGQQLFNIVRVRNLNFPLKSITNSYYLVIDNQSLLLNDLDNALKQYGFVNIPFNKNVIANLYSGDGEDITSKLDLEKAEINNCSNNPVSRNSRTTFDEGVLTFRSTGETICLNFNLNTLNTIASLYKLNMEFKSPEGIIGDSCIRFSEGCINTKIVKSDFVPNLWYPFSTYAQDEGTNRLSLSLVLNNSRANNTASISYRNILFSKHNLESSIEISTFDVQSDLRTSKDLIEVVPIDNKLSVRFLIPWNKKYTYNYRELQQLIPLASIDCKPYVDAVRLDRSLDNQQKTITFTSIDGFNCQNINLYNINLNNGFLINVEGENKSGPGLVLNVSDFFYKKVFYANRLPEKGEFNEFLTLPGLVNTPSNGLNLFVNNQSVGNSITENSLKSISVSPILYNWLSLIKVESKEAYINDQTVVNAFKLNTASFSAQIIPSNSDRVLAFNQSFEPNWLAYDNKGNLLNRFGEVNADTKKSEWNNYWILPAGINSVFIEYRTQTYQYFAYVVVSITFGVIIFFSLYTSRRFKIIKDSLNIKYKKLNKRLDLYTQRNLEPKFDKYKKFNKKDLS